MGVDLYIYGNHNLPLAGKSFSERVPIVQSKLDTLKIDNLDAIWNIQKDFYADVWDDPQFIRGEKNTDIGWDIDTSDFRFAANLDFVNCFGPLRLKLEVESDKITFDILPYRYYQWLCMCEDGANEVRNEWRKMMLQVLTHFGGDRLIYLPFGGFDSEKYIDIQDDIETPFAQLERELIAEYGVVNGTMPFPDDDDVIINYFIDDLADLKKASK